MTQPLALPCRLLPHRAPCRLPGLLLWSAFIIGVTGGTASGKTTVCMAIIQRLGVPSVTVLGMDRFYRSLQPDAPAHLHNFDVPDAFDFDMFHASIQQLVTSRSVPVPKYSYRTHQRLQDVDVIDQADVVIVEGILTLYHPEVRKLFDMKIYVDTDDDVRLARRSQTVQLRTLTPPLTQRKGEGSRRRAVLRADSPSPPLSLCPQSSATSLSAAAVWTMCCISTCTPSSLHSTSSSLQSATRGSSARQHSNTASSLRCRR